MILEASTMQTLQEVNVEGTLVEEEEEVTREEIETESFVCDNLEADTLSNGELFCTNYEGTEPKDV